MSISKFLNYVTDLDKSVDYKMFPAPLVCSESNGHTVNVRVVRGKEKVLEHANCTAKFLRSDGNTLLINGTFDNGTASVTLPQACYAYEGACKLTIQLVSGKTVSNILVLVGHVEKYDSDTFADPSHVIPSIDELLAQINLLEAVTKEAEEVVNESGKQISQLSESITDIENTVFPKYKTDYTFSKNNIDSTGLIASEAWGITSVFDATNIRFDYENKTSFDVVFAPCVCKEDGSLNFIGGGTTVAPGGKASKPYTGYPYMRVIMRKNPSSKITDGELLAMFNGLKIINPSIEAKILTDEFGIKHNNIVNRIASDERKFIGVPKYWETYLASKKASLLDKCADIGRNGVAFQFFSDFHCTSNAWNSCKVIDYVRKNCGIDLAVCGGDILNAHSKQEAKEYFSRFIKEYDCINMFGNHEMNGRGVGTSYNPEANWLTADEAYGLYMRSNEDTANTDAQNYFFVDNESQKVRYIFLDTKTANNDFAVDIIQQKWMESKIKELTDGWGVIVFAHIYFIPADKSVPTLTESTSGYAIRGIMNALGRKSTWADASLGISVDFRNANAEPIAVFVGHCHRDTSKNGYNYPIISITTDAYTSAQTSFDSLNRTLGTYTEQAVDVVFVNRTEKTIKTVRLGAGSDREFIYGTVL